MAVPKKKVSKSRRGNRRSHDSLNFQTVVECPIAELKNYLTRYVQVVVFTIKKKLSHLLRALKTNKLSLYDN